MSANPLDPDIADRIVGAVEDDERAFVVGGQAINFWARRYGIDKSLMGAGPMISKDIDFFGGIRSADRLSARLHGKVCRPGPDDHTPNSAVVEAEIGGEVVHIDFLDHVSGVSDAEIRKRVVEVVMPSLDQSRTITLSLMHPLHCLQSRLANFYRHGRDDEIALRQIEAAPLILEAFIDEMLGTDGVAEAQATLSGLFKWLRSDEFGRKSDQICRPDPLDILQRFAGDTRLDQRYREKTVIGWIRQIERRRSARMGTPAGS